MVHELLLPVLDEVNKSFLVCRTFDLCCVRPQLHFGGWWPNEWACSVLQCIAVYCSVLLCVAACCSVLQRVAACCSVLQCVAVCCSVLRCVALDSAIALTACCSVLQRVACRCGVLQCVAVCCSVLRCVALDSAIALTVCCSVLQRVAACVCKCSPLSTRIPKIEGVGNECLVGLVGWVGGCVVRVDG